MLRRAAVAIALGILTLAPASAIEKGQWEVAIGPDFHIFSNDLGVDNAIGARVRLGWHFSDRLELELAYQRVDTEDDFGEAAEFDDITYETRVLNLVWAIGSTDFQPFVLLGLGEAEGAFVAQPKTNQFTSDEDSSFLWQVGLGSRWVLSRHLGFRVQLAAARLELGEKAQTQLNAGVDLSVVWGQAK